MNEDKEKISAWLDDAIDLDEVDSLQATHGSGAYSTAARYSIIGDAVRGTVTDTSMIDISASVRAAIAISSEPEITPLAKPASTAQRDSKSLFGLGSWLRPVGGLAVAATVAMVMVVTLTDQQSETDNAVVANVGQQSVQAVPVNNTVPGYSKPGIALPAVNLNSYVTKHSEYAAQDTMQGLMPYARAVGYGAEKKPSTKHSAEDRQTAKNPGIE